MRQNEIKKALSPLVLDCGYAPVMRALRSMHDAGISNKSMVDKNKPSPVSRSHNKKSAVAVVDALNVTDDSKKRALMSLAEKYDAKTFMPGVNSARDFLRHKGMDVSGIKSRQQVASAVFKCLAMCQIDDIYRIADVYGPVNSLNAVSQAIDSFRRGR